MMINGHIRSAVMQAISIAIRANKPLAFMLQATAEAETHRQEAQMFGIEVIFEAFADRCYNDDGSLLSRSEEGAVHSRDKMLEQVEQLNKPGHGNHRWRQPISAVRQTASACMATTGKR